jgi:hypothetical protein
MTITQVMPNGFKTGLMSCAHNFSPANRAVTASTADTFKIALYTSSATLDKTTAVYSATNEIPGGGITGYTAGGLALVIYPTPTGYTTGIYNDGYISFSPAVWTSANFTANGALIYNSSNGNLAVAVLAFGSDKTVSGGGTFTVTFPTYAAGITVAAVQLS